MPANTHLAISRSLLVSPSSVVVPRTSSLLVPPTSGDADGSGEAVGEAEGEGLALSDGLAEGSGVGVGDASCANTDVEVEMSADMRAIVMAVFLNFISNLH